MPPRLYLDNAATSLPKPDAVGWAMFNVLHLNPASPGRGLYKESREAEHILREARELLAQLFRASEPDHFVFTQNGTDALNLAIKGVVRHARRQRPGESLHVVTTTLEHNSVLRPIAALAQDPGHTLDITHVAADPATGHVSPLALERAITARTALVVATHASNVTGAIQPIADIGQRCRSQGVPFLVDAAQTAGHLPIDLSQLPLDLLVAPGHKGLLGPAGTGILYVRPEFADRIEPTREGGTGTFSELAAHPTAFPHKFESGTPNTPGIAGLAAALRHLLAMPPNPALARELTVAMLSALRQHGIRTQDSLGGVGPLRAFRLLGPSSPDGRLPIFSLVHDHLSPAELAILLESQHRILARAGLHCAPLIHHALDAPHGSLRLSLGHFNHVSDVQAVTKALISIATQPGL